MSINEAQTKALLRGPDPKAVFTRKQAGREFTYLTQHAVRTELIRVFGFDGWDGEAIQTALITQREVTNKSGKTNWEVCWRVTYKLTVRWDQQFSNSTWIESAIGSATGPNLPDVLDQGLKSATSDAMKRCAMNLGGRFGLSLYFDGAQFDPVREVVPETMKVPMDGTVVPVPVTDGTEPEPEPEPAMLPDQVLHAFRSEAE